MTGMSDNKAASRPNIGVLNQPLRAPQRRTLLIAGIAVLLAGSAFVGWKYLSARPPAWLSRWRVQRYLKSEAHAGNFKVESFVFPSKAELNKAPAKTATATISKGSRTGKDFDELREDYFTLKTSALVLERGLVRSEAERKEAAAELEVVNLQINQAQAKAPPQADATTNVSAVSLLESNAATLRLRVADLQKKSASREELQARETSLAPVVSDLWDIQRGWQSEAEANGVVSAEFVKSRDQFAAELRQKFEKAGSYAAMYQLIGQELWVARQLLDSVNPEYIRAGMTFALSASRHALNEAQNGWVAARICDGYLLPHLEMADDTNRRSRFNRDNLLTECADIFRRNEEFGGVVLTYQMALAAAGTPQKADTARAQISMAYEQAGDFKQALHYLREIKETNDFRWAMRRAPRLEQQIKSH
jgi:hypothetical protein